MSSTNFTIMDTVLSDEQREEYSRRKGLHVLLGGHMFYFTEVDKTTPFMTKGETRVQVARHVDPKARHLGYSQTLDKAFSLAKMYAQSSTTPPALTNDDAERLFKEVVGRVIREQLTIDLLEKVIRRAASEAFMRQDVYFPVPSSYVLEAIEKGVKSATAESLKAKQ